MSHSRLRGASGVALGSLLGSVGARRDSLRSLVLNILSLVLDVGSSLLGGRGSAARAGKTDNDGNKGDQDSTNTTSDLRDELDGLNGVLLGDGDEEVKLLLDEVDGVIEELQVAGGLGLLRLLGLVVQLSELLKRVLLLEGLLGKLGSVLNRVSNVDVVEEDVVLHGPDLEANLL